MPEKVVGKQALGFREDIPWRAYVTMRLEELNAEIIAKTDECDELDEDLKSPSHRLEVQDCAVRHRRTYLTERLDILKKEKATLAVDMRIVGLGPPAVG